MISRVKNLIMDKVLKRTNLSCTPNLLKTIPHMAKAPTDPND